MRTRDDNKRQAINEKALKMIVEKGFDGMSMQKLARAAGVSPATIYIHFKDRDDMIWQLWNEEMKKMVAVTLEGFHPEMSFEEGLKVQWMNRARYCLENPLSMHFMEQIKYSPYHQQFMKQVDNRFSEILGAFVHNAIRKKELVKLPLEVYWSVAFAPLYQLVKFHISGRGLRGGVEKFVLDNKVMGLTLDLVIKALKP
jgi:TetR/AcrR family transcriptional regulator, multidrug resistance operon repressor